MIGGTTEVRNTRYNGYLGPRLPRDMQLGRVQRVIEEELTDLQREALVGFYFHQRTITELAAARGVNKSTVCRTLHRAEQKLRRFLKY